MKKLVLVLVLFAAGHASAADLIAQLSIPSVRCRASPCSAVGTVSLMGLPGTAIPAGTTLIRWDGATFTTASAAVVPAGVQVTSPDSMYDVPVGEALAAVGFPGVTGVVTANIGRYTTAAGAGAVIFTGYLVRYYSDYTRIPASVSLSYSDDFPPDFDLAVRQLHLLNSLFSGAQTSQLSPGALRDVMQIAQTSPRPAAHSGTRETVTIYAIGNPGRTPFQAPLYTEPRIQGPWTQESQQRAVAECGPHALHGCTGLLVNVRPENLPTVHAKCTAPDGRIDGACPWLQAHSWVRWSAIISGGDARWCRAEDGDPQRTFYDGGECEYVYGGDTLPPEAEQALFARVLADFEAR